MEEIYDYTAQHWGVQQANTCLASLRDLCVRLTSAPGLGAPSSRPAGYRRIRYESHFVFYVVGSGSQRIERVLHVRMSAARHPP